VIWWLSILRVFTKSVFQARQILEREFNNLLALGTDRRLEEVGDGSDSGWISAYNHDPFAMELGMHCCPLGFVFL